MTDLGGSPITLNGLPQPYIAPESNNRSHSLLDACGLICWLLCL